VVVALLLLSLAEARAQPPGAVPAGKPVDREVIPHRYPLVALGLSLGLSAAGGAMVVAGDDSAPLGVLTMYLGPSVGRWYGGGSAVVGLLGRTAGGALLVAGINEDISHPIDDDCIAEEQDCTEHDQAVAEHDRRVRRYFIAGGAVWLAATAFDIFMAPLDARAFNREHDVAVVPTVTSDGAGFAVSGRF